MKTHLNLALILSIAFVLSTSVSFAQTSSSATDCAFGRLFDSRTGTACANVATCLPGVTRNHLTNALCPGVLESSSNNDLILAEALAIIKNGDKNKEIVTEIQKSLLALGYQIKVDGIYGNGTKKIVMNLQRNAGLRTIDGIVGPNTFQALQKEINKKAIPISLITNVKKSLDRENVAFVAHARSVINMKDTSTWGTLISNENGSKWYKREFTGFRNGFDGKPKYYLIHSHQ